MKIITIEPESIAADLGIRPGDELLAINGERISDSIALRYHEEGENVEVTIARQGEVTIYEIEKEESERIRLELEEMNVLSCGNDCIFCFVDQNPAGLRNQLYFRDGDYRLSFMYGNYTTMTNAGPAILRRIVEQRLSPQYISVHVTDLAIRMKLMGLRKDDRILEKIAYLCENGIDMHTQIVLCPGINDGAVLERTVMDLAQFRERVISLAVVPVGLTDHRMGLTELRKVDQPLARSIVESVEGWQRGFRTEFGRGFVYASDEFYLTAGRDVPPAKAYDGFWQIENGVGFVRSFLGEFRRQSRSFPERLARRRRIILATGDLAAPILSEQLLPRLRRIAGFDAEVVTVPNLLYGRSVTVAGLLSGKCLYSALKGRKADAIILPPDILNADGLLLDDMTLEELEGKLEIPVVAFTGEWKEVFRRLSAPRRSR